MIKITCFTGGKLRMISLKKQLLNSQRKRTSAKPILGKYGVQSEEDASKPLGYLTMQQAMSQVINWITLPLKIGESTGIRLTASETKEVYTVIIENIARKGLVIRSLVTEPKLIGKVLHHWNSYVTYETLSLFEIKASIECADALNSFNDDIEERKIDDLVNEAIALDLPTYDKNLFNILCE